MKRKSTLILIAALVLAVAIPVFALAAGGPRFASTSGTTGSGRYYQAQRSDENFVPLGNQFALQDYQVDADGFCYFLDENGEPQRVYSRGTDGQYLYLHLQDGEYCWYDGNQNQIGDPIQMNNSFGGRGGSRWN